jgi:hypothetical protein
MAIEPQDRKELIALARQAVESAVLHLRPPVPGRTTGVLGEMRGCFVTLTNKGALRGCVGTFEPPWPLVESIIEMGREAARDGRFVANPITPAELPHLTIEVSVLSPRVQTREPEKLDVGKHGIYITNGKRSGCFLPEVATDQGWDAVEFLSYCCSHKAGLPPDAWRMADTSVYLFTSEKFAE